jgi:hypothetical protein
MIESGPNRCYRDRMIDADDDDVYWGSIPRRAYWLALFAIAGVAYAVIHLA